MNIYDFEVLFSKNKKIDTTFIDSFCKDKKDLLKKTNNGGNTILHCLFSNKFYEKIEPKLFEIENSLKVKNNKNETIFHKYCERENVSEEILSLFIQNKANINEEDFQKNSPFHLICDNQNLSQNENIFQLFLSNNADPNFKNRFNKTPFSVYCESKNSTFEIVKNFVSYNADLNIYDNLSNNPFIYLFEKNLSNLHHMRFLITHKADINSHKTTSSTILHLACSQNIGFEFISYLIENGAMIEKKDIQNNTPFFYLLKFRNLDLNCLSLFLEKGYDINTKCERNLDALNYISAFSIIDRFDDSFPTFYDACCLFISHKIDVNSQNRSKKTSFQIAESVPNLAVLEALSEFQNKGTVWSQKNHHLYPSTFK